MKSILQLLAIFLISIGANAQWTYPDSGITDDLNDVHFPTSNIGYAVGEGGSIIKSVDAGDSWTVLTSGVSSLLEGVHFLNDNLGYVVGDNVMLKTSNGGINWTTVTLPETGHLMDVEFTNATNGFCVGSDGILLKTSDAGLNWIAKNSDCNRYLSKIQFPSESVGYATSRGYNSNFIKTTDGGETWFSDTIDANLIYGSFESVYFMTEDVGLIGSWYIYGLVKTTDGGANWVDVSGPESPDLYSIDFANGSVGFAGDINGLFMTTTDAGDNWTSETITPSILALQALSATEVICVGSDGAIAKKANATSSIEDEKQLNINVFPNPSNGQFNISMNSNENKQIKVYTVDSKLIQQWTSSDYKTLIEIEQGTGVYFLEVMTNSSRETFKLIVK
ncbi:MAG: photosystem II stability/assembly factor-like uncharacterized protein [Arenicella sp.]|jgi:photosystem II stability/assembly factor-like uncharacterized protein